MLWPALIVKYVAQGLSVIPMGDNKRPLVKWMKYQEFRPRMSDISTWMNVFSAVERLAIVTGKVSNIVVVDCESREDAEWFWRTKGETSVVVETRRGFHFYFRHPGCTVRNAQRVFGRYDVRGDGGYVLAPPSLHKSGRYKWVKPLVTTAELPVFDLAWRPDNEASPDKKYIDGARYVSAIRAVSGQGGHSDTFRACCVLRDSGFSEGECLLGMQEWNATNAEPPWSDRELLHKVRSAYTAKQ